MDEKLRKKYIKLLKQNTARPVAEAILYYLQHKDTIGEKKYNFIVKIVLRFLKIETYESKQVSKYEYIEYKFLTKEIADKIVEVYKEDSAVVKKSEIEMLLDEMNEIF